MSEQESDDEILEELDIQKLRQDLIDSRSEGLVKLKNAHNSLVKTVNQKINERIKNQLERQPKSDFVHIHDPHSDANLEGFSLEVLLDGYYNKEKEEYSRKRHEKAGIKKDPLTQLEEFYAKKNPNFTIEDVSDSTKSQRWVIKVTF